jgi:hypothetical protein
MLAEAVEQVHLRQETLVEGVLLQKQRKEQPPQTQQVILVEVVLLILKLGTQVLLL